MASFGEILKRERELRAITLREISAATKISIRHLEALENNRFESLPGGLFNKGFIRAYASYVGIDGDEMVNHYLFEVDQQESEPDPIAELKAVLPPETRKGNRQARQWIILAAILLGGIALFTFLRYTLVVPEEEEERAQPAAADRQVLGAAFSDLATDDYPSPEPRIPPVPEPGPEMEAGAAAGTFSFPEVPPPPAVVDWEPDREIKFRFKVIRPTRVRIVCDGTEVLDKYLEAGQRRSYRCMELRLTTPDAGALQYSLNRGDWHFRGPDGMGLDGAQIPPRDPTPRPSAPGEDGGVPQDTGTG